MILAKRADADRFLARPPEDVRVALIWGRDRGGVRERADGLAKKVCDNPEDPFDAALLTEADVDGDGARLADELCAISMLGGRRLVRLRLTGEKPAVDRAAADAVKVHAEGGYNADAFFLIEAGALERGSALRKAAEGLKTGAVSIPVYEDEVGDIARFVREALAADKVGLNPEALDVFVNRLPKERGVARQEIERLILYLGPGSGVTAAAADLTDHLGVEPEASLFDAAADAFSGRAAQCALGAPARPGGGRGRACGGAGDQRPPEPPAPRPDPGRLGREPGGGGQEFGRVLEAGAGVHPPAPQLVARGARPASGRGLRRRPGLQVVRRSGPPDQRAPGARGRRTGEAAGPLTPSPLRGEGRGPRVEDAWEG